MFRPLNTKAQQVDSRSVAHEISHCFEFGPFLKVIAVSVAHEKYHLL